MRSRRPHKTRLGIDAKWYFEGPPSGKMVVCNLVNEMVRNNNDRFELYLFVTSKHIKQARAVFAEGIHLVRMPKLPNMLANMFVMPLVALRYRLDVLLFQNFGSRWPARLFKIVYIHDVLFLDYPEYYTRLERYYFKKMKSLATHADMVITISETERQRLIRNQVINRSSIAVVYHGINQDFKPLGQYNCEQIQAVLEKYRLPRKYLLYVGRVNVRKNLKNLARAVSLLHDANLKLVIAGERPSNNGLEYYIQTQCLADKIIFTGHVPEEDLHIIYANATVFCFPSYAEGFGLPPLEAMQCGVPVVVSNRTAMPEVCGEAATYIDPDDARDIARKIDALLHDAELYDKKKADGLCHAHGFTWERSANAILTLIENAYAG